MLKLIKRIFNASTISKSSNTAHPYICFDDDCFEKNFTQVLMRHDINVSNWDHKDIEIAWAKLTLFRPCSCNSARRYARSVLASYDQELP